MKGTWKSMIGKRKILLRTNKDLVFEFAHKYDDFHHRSPEVEMDYTKLAKAFKKKIEASKIRDRELKHLVQK